MVLLPSVSAWCLTAHHLISDGVLVVLAVMAVWLCFLRYASSLGDPWACMVMVALLNTRVLLVLYLCSAVRTSAALLAAILTGHGWLSWAAAQCFRWGGRGSRQTAGRLADLLALGDVSMLSCAVLRRPQQQRMLS